MSDRSGSENIWMTPLTGQPKQVTTFRAGRVLFPDISADGRTIVFDRNFGIWSLDVSSGRAARVSARCARRKEGTTEHGRSRIRSGADVRRRNRRQTRKQRSP